MKTKLSATAKADLLAKGLKFCPDCETVKPVEEFTLNAANPDGRNVYCSPCARARGQAYRQRDKEDTDGKLRKRIEALEGSMLSLQQAADKFYRGSMGALLVDVLSGNLAVIYPEPLVALRDSRKLKEQAMFDKAIADQE